MAKYIALWKKANDTTGYLHCHLEPIEADNYQVLLDDAKENDITVTTIFDVTDENKEPEKVYSLLTQSESAGKAPTLSGLYNCLLCGEEKCRQPGICEDCLIPPSENDQTNKELT